jgi:hypothetical protein
MIMSKSAVLIVVILCLILISFAKAGRPISHGEPLRMGGSMVGMKQ